MEIAGKEIIAITAKIARSLRERGLELPTERSKYWDTRVWSIAVQQHDLHRKLDQLDKELAELANG